MMNMKKIIYSLLIGALALPAVSCMEVDNWDAPEARFSGRIIDKNTGKPILADQGEYKVRLYEMSFSTNPDPFDIPVKQDGTFNNHRIFAGTYDVILEGAWWPRERFTGIGVGNKGTDRDFEVVPYYTVADEDFTATVDTSDPENPVLTVSCRVGISIEDETPPDIAEIRPMLSLNQFCGAGNCIGQYNTNTYRIKGMTSWNALEKDADGKSSALSTSIPVKAGYTYFVRVGVRVNTTPAYHNYSKIIEVNVPQ
jgi:hypothetical protein